MKRMWLLGKFDTSYKVKQTFQKAVLYVIFWLRYTVGLLGQEITSYFIRFVSVLILYQIISNKNQYAVATL